MLSAGNLEVVEFLLEKGLNDAQAIKWTTTNRHLEVVKFPVEYGA
jgi:hypothetical protein